MALYSANRRPMLQAHSFLWNYLWVAPDILQLVLCLFLWKRRLIRDFPAFFAFALITAISELVLYAADLLPFISGLTYWGMRWAGEVVAGVLKFAVIGEIFSKLFGDYASLARLGKILIQWVGATFVFGAVLAAGYAPKYQFAGIITGADLLLQSIYLIECGVLVFIFLFASYFHLRWPRQVFGIALGLGASACVYLATWGLINNALLPAAKRDLLVLINGSAFHLEVLIWFYYLLVPQHAPVRIPAPLPENNLALWNRELERLLHQ
jgi:hypothetical protein